MDLKFSILFQMSDIFSVSSPVSLFASVLFAAFLFVLLFMFLHKTFPLFFFHLGSIEGDPLTNLRDQVHVRRPLIRPLARAVPLQIIEKTILADRVTSNSDSLPNLT